MNAYVRSLPIQILALLVAGCSAGTDGGTEPSGYGIDTVAQSAVASPQAAMPVEAASLSSRSIVEAEPELDASSASQETNVDHQAAGRAAWERGDFEEAARHLRVATESGGAAPYDTYLYGLSSWKSGRLDEAEEALVKASAMLASFPRADVNLARVRLEKHDLSGAHRAADEALQLDADFGPAHNVLGRVLLEEGDRDAAAESFRRAAELDEADPWPLNNLGYLLIVSGRADEAIAPLEEAVARDEGLARAWHNLALARERAGDAFGAFSAAQKAANLDGADEQYRATADRLAELAPPAPASGADEPSETVDAQGDETPPPVEAADARATTSPSL